MSRFSTVCDRFDPELLGKRDEIIAFLESKGLVVESTNDPKKFKIQLPIDDIVLEYNSLKTGVGSDVNDEVDRLSDDEDEDLNDQAKIAIRKRETVSKKALDSFEDSTKNIEKNIKS